MLFCTVSSSNIQVLTNFFGKYAEALGQVINPHKSTIYGRALYHTNLTHIAISIGFNIGFMPFTYLGVPIFKGKPRRIKLASWKEKMLRYNPTNQKCLAKHAYLLYHYLLLASILVKKYG